jgi:hypothetical protein
MTTYKTTLEQLKKELEAKERKAKNIDPKTCLKTAQEYVRSTKDKDNQPEPCNLGEDRNDVLKDIVNDDKVYEITFVVDRITDYDMVSRTNTRVVGCRCIVINIDGEDRILNHTWLKECYIPEITKRFKLKHVGEIKHLKVKVKSYDNNKDKYEFTTIF